MSAASDRPPYIIAEISGNHGGSLERARELVIAAAEAGADSVKFQTYTADTLTLRSDAPAFRISDGHDLWGGRTLHDLYEEAHTPWEWHEELFALARENGIEPFSSPFDATAVDFLETLSPAMYKIASLEIIDTGLLRKVAATGRPVILSNGSASVAELATAVETLQSAGVTDLTVLACTSAYPADPKDSNLRSIPALRDVLGVPVGLSDHTLGIGVAIAAVALGARVIEKHLTLSRDEPTVDSAFSLEPAELASLVRETRAAWEALGETSPRVVSAESETHRLRRSLWVAENVRAGDPVTEQNVRSVRPAGGLAPVELDAVLGRRFTRDVPAATPMSWDLV